MHVPDQFIEDMQIEGTGVRLQISHDFVVPHETRTIETDRYGRWIIVALIRERTETEGSIVRVILQQ
ncbi:hypothetical protein ACVWZX_003917 [Deinococcus sp. UYEF24]